MGFTVVRDAAGTAIPVRIGGAAPTPVEQQRIDRFLAKRNASLPPVPAAPVPEPGFFTSFGREAARGYGTTLTSLPGGIAELAGLSDNDPRNSWTGRLSDTSTAYINQQLGPPVDNLAGTIGNAFGSMGAFLTAPLALAGIGVSAPVAAVGGTLAAGGLGILAGADQMGRDVDATAAANGTPISREDRTAAVLTGAATGALEAAPVHRVLGPLIKPVEDLLRGLSPTVGRRVLNTVTNAVATGGVEAGQELVQNVTNDLVAKGLYDPNRDPLGSAYDSIVGAGGAGAITQLLATALGGRRAGRYRAATTELANDLGSAARDATAQAGFADQSEAARTAQAAAIAQAAGRSAATPATLAPGIAGLLQPPDQTTIRNPPPPDMQTGAPPPPAPPRAPPAAPPVSTAPNVQLNESAPGAAGVAAVEINRARRIADKVGVTQDIEDLSAAGKTADQVVAALQKAKKLDFIEQQVRAAGSGSAATARAEALRFVRGVRTTLGVPSQDQKTEFQDWKKRYQERKAKAPPAPPSPTPSPIPATPPSTATGPTSVPPPTPARPDTTITFDAAPVPFKGAQWSVVNKQGQPIAGQQFASKAEAVGAAIQSGLSPKSVQQVMPAGKPGTGFAVVENETAPDGRVVGQKVRETGFPTLEAAQERARSFLDAPVETTSAQPVLETTPDQMVRPPMPQYAKTLRDRLTKIVGKETTLKIAPLIEEGLARNPDGTIKGFAEGLATSKDGAAIIKLAKAIYNPKLTDDQLLANLKSVMDHEMIHALKSLGKISPKEWDTLVRFVTKGKRKGKRYTYLDWAEGTYKDVPGYDREAIVEEAVAEAFRDYASGYRPSPPANGVFGRIIRFVKDIGRAFRRSDAANAQSIFEGVEAGNLSARPVAPDQTTTRFSYKETQDGQANAGRGTGGGRAWAEETQGPLSSHPARLQDLPANSLGPNPRLVEAAREYLRSAGIPERRQAHYVKASRELGKKIADAYDAMAHAPDDPQVRAAYEAMARETVAQYQAVKATGLKIEAIEPGMPDPYPIGPTQVHEDLRNGHLWFFPTESGFGQDAAATFAAEAKTNPLLAPTDETIGGRRLLVNDIFRIVHDVFGHGREGVGFGASGEENTWQSHVRMYSPLAAKAMTSETRGQNSWVNYGPYGDRNRTSQKETVYADQKLGILPDWVMSEGLAPDMKRKPEGKFSYKTTTAPVYYSALGKGVEELPIEVGAARQWKAALKKSFSSPEMLEERAWSGIDKWLDSLEQPGTNEKGFPADVSRVTKDQVVEYLRANDLNVQDEIQYSAVQMKARALNRAYEDLYQIQQKISDLDAASLSSHDRQIVDGVKRKITAALHDYGRSVPSDANDFAGPGRRLNEASGQLTWMSEDDPKALQIKQELTADLDRILSNIGRDIAPLMDEQDPEIVTGDYFTMALKGDRQGYRQMYLTLPGITDKYDAGHFSHVAPNVVAHVRFDERSSQDNPLEDRLDVAFVNEIQSDWHQSGAQYGYKESGSAQRFKEASDRINNVEDRYDAVLTSLSGLAREARALQDELAPLQEAEQNGTASTLGGEAVTEIWRELEALQRQRVELTNQLDQLRAELNAAYAARDAADSIGVPDAPLKTTWHQLAMRRMLRWAADNGKSYLAWPATPAQVAHIEKYGDLKETPDDKTFGGVRYGIRETNTDVTPIIVRYMKLPRDMNAYAKGLGSELHLITLDGGEMVAAIPITPAMRGPVRKFSYKMAAPMGSRVPPANAGVDLVNTNLRYGAVSEAILKLTPAKYKEWVQGKTNSFLDNFVDDAYSLGQLIDYIRDHNGSVAEAADVVMKRQLFAGRTGEALEDAATYFYRPMNEAIDKIGATATDTEALAAMDPKIADFLRHAKNPNLGLFELYLYARHAPERNAVMRVRNPLRADGTRTPYHDAGSGMTDATAARVISYIQGSPFAAKIAEATARHDAVIASTNSIRLAKGLIGPEMPMPEEFALAGLPDGYKFYTPLRGVVEEDPDADPSDKMDMADAKRARTGRGLNIRGREDPTATGRASMGADLVAHVMLQNEETIIRGEKNVVLQSFLKLLEDHGDKIDGFATIVDKVPMVARLVNGKVQMMADSTFSNREDVVNVKVDGEKVMIQVHNLRILEAFKGKKGVGAQQLGTFMSGVASVGRFLAALRTTYSPEFALTNPIRDFIIANVNMSQLEKENMLRNLRSNMPKAMKVLMAQQMGKSMDPTWAKNLEDYRKAGGTTQFYGMRDLDLQLKALNKTLNSQAPGLAGKGWNTITRMKDFIEKTNYVFENATRLAAFQAMRDIGFSNERAAQIGAKSATTNFNRGGHYKAMMNAWYLFFNASIGGTMTLAESATRSPRVRKILAGAMIAGLIQDAIMSAISDEDDDGTLVYDKIPDWVLAHNFVMPWGNERGYITIPLPYGFNAFYNFGRGLAAGIRRGDSPYKTAGDTLSVIVDTFNPIGGASNLLNFVAPTIADPIVDLWGTNIEEFSGRPVYPESSGFGPPRPKSQLYWNNTSGVYKSAAEYLSWITGGEGTIPGAIEVSPNQLEYVVQFLTGATGTFVQRLYSLGAETIPSYLDGTLDEITAADIPLVRRFVGNVTTRNDMERYIKARDSILMVRREVKEAREAGDPSRIEAVRRRFPVEYRLSEPFNRMNSAYNKMLASIRDVERGPLSEQEKLRITTGIRRQMDALVTRALRMVHDAQEAA